MRAAAAGAVGEGLAVLYGQRLPAPARGWRREGPALRGGKQGDGDHEVSILIRLGDEDRAGRAPSNVSMMIIRPPQQGHRSAGESVCVSPSALLGGGLGAASNCRALSILSARTAPANRP